MGRIVRLYMNDVNRAQTEAAEQGGQDTPQPSGFSIPYSIDFSTGSKGELLGPTFSVSGGKLINTPVLGGELLANGGFETGDPPSSWNAINSTLDSVNDTRTGGSGTKSLATIETGSIWSYGYQIVTAAIGTWLRFTGWGKRVDSSHWGYFLSGSTQEAANSTLDTWSSFTESDCVVTANPWARTTMIASVNGESSRFDDWSVKPYTASELFALCPSSQKNVTLRINANTTGNQVVGIVLRANSQTNPTDYILIRYSRFRGQLRVDQFVAGAPTVVTAYTNAGLDDTPSIEARITGTSLKVLFNTVEIISTTVNVASINDNTFHGVWETGDADGIDAFFLSAL